MAKRTTTIGTRLDAALLTLQLQAQGPAVDPSRDLVDSGKPTTQRPPDYGNDHAVWLERAERLVDAMVASLRQPEARRQKTLSEVRSVIRTYEGRDHVYVAYHEHCSVRTVERARAALGLDSLGFKVAKPLTSREFDTGRIPSDSGGMLYEVDNQPLDADVAL